LDVSITAGARTATAFYQPGQSEVNYTPIINEHEK